VEASKKNKINWITVEGN